MWGDPHDVGTAGNVPQAGAPHCAGSSWEPGDSLIKRFIIKAAVFLGACFLLLLWGQTGRHPAGAALGDSMQPDTPLRILNLHSCSPVALTGAPCLPGVILEPKVRLGDSPV